MAGWGWGSLPRGIEASANICRAPATCPHYSRVLRGVTQSCGNRVLGKPEKAPLAETKETAKSGGDSSQGSPKSPGDLQELGLSSLTLEKK
jgi:hypothetical protein